MQGTNNIFYRSAKISSGDSDRSGKTSRVDVLVQLKIHRDMFMRKLKTHQDILIGQVNTHQWVSIVR